MSRLSPKQKILAASCALMALFAIAASQGASPSSIARVLIGIGAVVGMTVWFARQRGLAPKLAATAPRLAVVARTGLSQRAGVALIEVDGKPFIVVHGDGYAQVHPTASPSFRDVLANEVQS
jgi:hypothetical protein